MTARADLEIAAGEAIAGAVFLAAAALIFVGMLAHLVAMTLAVTLAAVWRCCAAVWR